MLWDLTAKKPAAILEQKDTGPIYGLAAGSDGKTLAAGCGLSIVMLWDLPPNNRAQSSRARQAGEPRLSHRPAGKGEARATEE